jgi:hypothetical protein
MSAFIFLVYLSTTTLLLLAFAAGELAQLRRGLPGRAWLCGYRPPPAAALRRRGKPIRCAPHPQLAG